jgi:ribonuclease Y
MLLTYFFIAVVSVLVGVIVGFFVRALLMSSALKQKEESIDLARKEAEQLKRTRLLEAREEIIKYRSEAEREIRDSKKEIFLHDRRVIQRDENLTRKTKVIEERENNLVTKENNLVTKENNLVTKENNLEDVKNELDLLQVKYSDELEKVADLSKEEAKKLILSEMEKTLRLELAKQYKNLEEEYKAEADASAKKVITLAINRLASDVVSESSTTVIPLPNDEMKGRLIGREGRNIRTFESLTGVDVIVDETPGQITISCFDPLRRETAKLALQKLILDGRIQPTRIEEIIQKSREEVDDTIKSEGERAIFESGVSGIRPELVKLLGVLKYRYSYGENILQHSVEVSHIAGMLAAEIGANVKVAKAGGLFHDIGKALSHEVEGGHAEIGADIARKYGIEEPVYRAIMEHHDEEKGSVEAFLVASADAISAARPGSRKETLERYVKRLEELETVAKSFDGINEAFAIQAGREVRIMVKPEEVTEAGVSKLARDVTKKIESDLVYPGNIKVTVIREIRDVQIAK